MTKQSNWKVFKTEIVEEIAKKYDYDIGDFLYEMATQKLPYAIQEDLENTQKEHENQKTWWIVKDKPFTKDVTKWYYNCCETVTEVERNPEWNGEFKGTGQPPEWFICCKECKYNYQLLSEYGCPDCGWDKLPEEALEYTHPVSNIGASMNCGGDPKDWDEKYHCPFCDTDFWISGSNY